MTVAGTDDVRSRIVDQDRVARWADSVDEQQRAAARRSVSNGRLDREAFQALRAGGLVDPSEAEDGPVPRDVIEHFKTRHD